ncbi:MAG: YbaB/EbfC family nucleoid-associated protein [Spirochaetota bacterium]
MLGKKMADTFSKMKDMKKQMAAVQKRIALIRVTASAGAGMVDVTVTGDGNVSDIKINKELFEADDVKMLEDLIISATNDALKKAKDAMAHEMKSITGGIDPSKLTDMFGGAGD